MSAEAAPERIVVAWSPEARADLRAIERETAIQILHCIDRYLINRNGDVKKLKPPQTGFRLRCGDYRVFFDLKSPDAPLPSQASRTDGKPTAEPCIEFRYITPR